MGLAKRVAKRFLSLTRNIFVKADPFKEAIENELGEVLKKASEFTSLDDLKATLVQTAFTTALISSTGGTGAIAGVLTAERINMLSKLIVKAGHKAEYLMARQLMKK